MLENVTICTATQSDARGIAALFGILGHNVKASSIEARRAGGNIEDDSVFVAESSKGRVVGMVTTSCSWVMHRDQPIGRVTSLVVDPEFTGHGIGRNLLTMAEQRPTAGGCSRLEIVSNNRFADTHRFYQHLGYAATGGRLQKNVDQP